MRKKQLSPIFPLLPQNTEYGFTLIEFMVASSLALVVLLAIGITYGTTSRMKRTSENRLAAQQDLRNVSELVLRDAQMAGAFGCFNMGNLVPKELPTSPGSSDGFQSPAKFQLKLGDPNYNGISTMSNTDASAAFSRHNFIPKPRSKVLVFTYGLHPTPLDSTGTKTTGASEELRSVVRASGHVALSSCSRMYIDKHRGNNIKINSNEVDVSDFGTGPRTSNSNNSAVFYIPQTTLSQVYSAAYVVGRINGVNDTDALYRFTLDKNGQWSNPQLMAANIQSMQYSAIYSGCDDTSTKVTFSENRDQLKSTANITRVSTLPTIIEVQLRLNNSPSTYGVVNQYLIRANVRGGNICANLF
ncbi:MULTISPECIES: PilW family protein [unclassified Eikenella]|uniref:PilW family protein n=1 Tax=unclassified Eikenella TaxID=2639367 RepID=UPI000AA585B5|nr:MULTISPECIES: prepilin-type N-terminal cleavage/methylation domain-containing protein [unclassified Eikenella]VDG99274.1 Tfp pilus assembly protein PilW [Helicobacter pametensis]